MPWVPRLDSHLERMQWGKFLPGDVAMLAILLTYTEWEFAAVVGMSHDELFHLIDRGSQFHRLASPGPLRSLLMLAAQSPEAFRKLAHTPLPFEIPALLPPTGSVP